MIAYRSGALPEIIDDGRTGFLVNSAAESIRPLMDERKHTLSVTLPPESIWLDADPTRLEQVLTNLLSNAARYTEPGGRVWLTAEQAGTQALVRVRDTGIGIAAEMLPRIFEPFVQVERSIARTQGGLGIGLTVAQSLAQMHGGTIEAASAGIGKGSEFTVRLPFMPEAASSSPEAAAAMERRKGRSLRVLIAEDNVDAAETLATLLRLYGHEVSVVHSGTGVIPQMQACSPEVVLLDIGLPSLDGYEVARLVRRQQGFENVPLIAMTGYGQEADRQQSRQAGFDAHLVKPIDPDRLQDLLLRLGKS